MQTSGEMRRENAKARSAVIASQRVDANALPDDRLRDSNRTCPLAAPWIASLRSQ